ncbi:MAG: TetR/AcrR family transcriptional regulator [Acidimicrobiales bacterium]
MAARRFSDRPRTRAPGAGRPRKRERTSEGPVPDEIVRAAVRLFARQGVAATTMADIAEAVGLGVSSLYYYFQSKHDIFERIVIEVNREPLTIVAEVRERFPDAGRRLHAFVRADAAALCELPFDFNEIHRLAGDDPDGFDRYWADRQRLLDEVAEIVRQGVDDGEFVPVDADLTAVTVLANDEAVQHWFRHPTGRSGAGGPGRSVAPSDPAAIGSFLADLVVRGLLADPARLGAIGADTA